MPTLEERIQAIEDREAIRALKAAYCTACDGGWDRPAHDPDAVADLFVEDGEWSAGEIGGAQGREAIRELFQGYRSFRFAFHQLGNGVIDLNGDTATASWHVIVPIMFTGDQPHLIGGIYTDEFRRTADGWKFKKILFTKAFLSTHEIGWGVDPDAVAAAAE